MKGYRNRPEVTDRAISDGWYSVSERRSDLIVSGGMNVYPSEVETAIGKLPEVADVVIVGGARNFPHGRRDRRALPTPSREL
jgi:acyl-CoA synthetase (AMP-forming)/AMP-acid ligase II